jgi:catechol 2,3-dioxygenase-like lactoylglutathione lyase family enzyme
MAPKLVQVNIAVRDMDAMAAFYERLGLSMTVGHPDWAAHHRSASGSDGPDIDLDSVAFTSWWNKGWVEPAA